MLIDDWLKSVQATPTEAKEVRLYLVFLRWRKSLKCLLGFDT